MNLSKHRHLMVQNQLRPNKINNPKIYNIFNDLEKENFLDKNFKNLAYTDQDINLIENRGYLKNLHIAQLIFHSKFKGSEKVLHIGGLTGYITTILSKLSKMVYVIENDEKLIYELKKNIKKYNLDNVETIQSEFMLGYEKLSPYDIVFIDSPLYDIPNFILKQINSNNGKLIFIKKINDNLCKAIRITKVNENYNDEYLFDVFTNFELYKEKESFVF